MIIKVEVQNDIFNDNKFFEIYEASEEDYNTEREIIISEWKNNCQNSNHTTEMFEKFKEILEEHGIVYRDIEEDTTEIIKAIA